MTDHPYRPADPTVRHDPVDTRLGTDPAAVRRDQYTGTHRCSCGRQLAAAEIAGLCTSCLHIYCVNCRLPDGTCVHCTTTSDR